ncbi:MAG: hypothetical protein VB082_03150 [Christensenella sp.]|nr:hypothetical protein [Christensenella sp.]
MKKRIGLLVLAFVAAFCFAMPVAGAASGAGSQGGTATAASTGSSLTIDNEHQYLSTDGTPLMEKTYQQGYRPIVANGMANIVLPLLAGADVDTTKPITTTIDMGDATSSPFVIKNYEKTYAFGNNKVTGGTQPSYLVAYDLELSPSRQNGVYPVVITASYTLSDGTQESQQFTVFVTISDVPAPAPEPEPTPDAGGGGGTTGNTSQAKLIISNYTITPDPVNAGDKFTVEVTLRNTSKKQTVRNITATFKSAAEGLSPSDNTNTAYIEKIGADKTETFSFSMSARADSKSGPQKIEIALAYEDGSAAPLTATDEVTVEVHQKIRLTHDDPKFPTEATMGDSLTASLNLYNKGKSTLYNVTVKLEVPGIVPESSAFLGNMESGTSKTADIYASVESDTSTAAPEGDPSGGTDASSQENGGMASATKMATTDTETGGSTDAGSSGQIGGGLSPDAGTQSAQPGPVEGNLVVTYEDEYGEAYELKIPVKTTLVPMPSYDDVPMDEPVEETPQGLPVWAWIAIAGGAAAVVIVIVLKKKKKKRAQELMEEMDDDDIL